MTLDSSSPANAVTAATGSQPDGDRPREVLHERPDLGALEALLADPVAVSSEETALAGFISKPLGQDKAGAGTIGPFGSRTDDSLVDALPKLPTHAPDAPTGSERTVDDGLAAHPSVPAESPVAPIEHDIQHADTLVQDGTAADETGEHGSSRAGAMPVATRDISGHEISAEDPGAGNTGAADTSAFSGPEAVQTETNAGPSVNEHSDQSGGAIANGPDGTAASEAANAAASLDDALLREIAEAPSVSSDSAASDKVDAVFLALDAPAQESGPATGTDTLDGFDIESFFDGGSRGPEATEAADALEAASLGSEVASAAKPVGDEEADRLTSPSRIGISADSAGRAGGDCTNSAALLTGSDSAGSSAVPAARNWPEERGDAFTAAVSLPEPVVPGVGSSTDPLEADKPSAASSAGAAAVSGGTASVSDASDANLQDPPESEVPTASHAHERLEPAGEAAGDRSGRDVEAAVNTLGGLLDDTLLRDIAESPAISSDSVSSEQVGTVDLAVDSQVHDSDSVTEAASLRNQGLGRDFDHEAQDSESPATTDAVVENPARREVPKLDAVQSADGADSAVGGARAKDPMDGKEEPVARAPDLGGPPPAGSGVGLDGSAFRRLSGAVAASVVEPDVPAEPDSRDTGVVMSCDVPGEPAPSVSDRNDPVAWDVASLEGPGRIALSETKSAREEAAPVPHERHKEHTESATEATAPARPTVPGVESPFGPADSNEPAAAVATEDIIAKDADTESDIAPVIHHPDLSGSLPSGTGTDHKELLLRQIADVVAASAGAAAGAPPPGLAGRGTASIDEQNDGAQADAPRSEDSASIALPGPEGSERPFVPIVPATPEGPTDSLREAAPESTGSALESPSEQAAPDKPKIAETTDDAGDFGAAPAESESESFLDPTNSKEAVAATVARYAVATDAEIEDDASSVIHLPDLRSLAPFEASGGQTESVVPPADDAIPDSSSEPAAPPETATPLSEDAQARGSDGWPDADDGPAADDMSPGHGGVGSLSESDESAVPADSAEFQFGDDRQESESDKEDRGEASADATGIVFDDTLLVDLAAVAPISSDEDIAPERSSAAAGGSAEPDAHLVSAPEPAFDVSLPHTDTVSLEASGDEPDPEYAHDALEAVSPGPAAALAFATDADTELALRDGLIGFGSASAGTGEPQVWQGGLKAAIAALAEGRTAPLVIVDIDGVPYPAGAIHELAAVCEVGTLVVAVGSDVSARPGRELLLSGVSDYLAKPLTAEAVRGVASRALAGAAGRRPGGRVASFVGCGGSGATTLAAATALHAASRGCYVSVLDLSRTVAAAALALGVEPVAGLDQLLETTDKVEVEPESLEGVCGRRSDRIEVYAHRWSPEHPAAATAAAVDHLLAALRQRSQLVLVDGLDEAEMRFLPSVEIDTRVFVAEPTTGQVPRLARILDLLGGGRPTVFVQNHTRSFRRNAGSHALREAGTGIEPDLTVSFDPAVPETADRGWPQGRLPRSLRKPVSALTDRLLDGSTAADAAAAFARAA